MFNKQTNKETPLVEKAKAEKNSQGVVAKSSVFATAASRSFNLLFVPEAGGMGAAPPC